MADAVSILLREAATRERMGAATLDFPRDLAPAVVLQRVAEADTQLSRTV